MKFLIKKINPLIDFSSDKMPQIFTDILNQRKEDVNRTRTTAELIKLQQDMYSIIEAGVVDPVLVPVGSGDTKGKEDGITVEDLFRNPDIGYGLYSIILDHSLNKFRGIKKLFFSIKTKYLQFIIQRKIMAQLQSESFSQKEAQA
jgi:hypothetical protein